MSRIDDSSMSQPGHHHASKKSLLRQQDSHNCSNRRDLNIALRLKLILGMTYTTGNCCTVHPKTGLCAYTASNAIVLFDTINARQFGYLKNSKKPLDTIRFSTDGTMILTGESGHMPPVCVWDVATRTCIGMLYGHQYGIKCVAFSPAGDLIVSVGNVFDGFICTWSWPGKQKIASNKFSEEIIDLAFSPSKPFFVTCGVHHVKFWYPESISSDTSVKTPKVLDMDSVLYGRPAILGETKPFTFTSVVCGTEKTASFVYTITGAGHVNLLSSGMRDVIITKSLGKVQLSCICVHDDLAIVASREGTIYFLDALTLETITTLALPVDQKYITKMIKSEGQATHKDYPVKEATYNTYMCYDYFHRVLTVFSSDGKLSVWDAGDINNVFKKLCVYYHCGGITCSDILPVESKGHRKRHILVTVSSDATIRLWGLDVTKTICCDGVTIICTNKKSLMAPVNVEKVDSGTTVVPPDENENQDLLTTVKINSDYVVTGDSHGSVVAYSMSDLEAVVSVRYHFRGVTCLEFFDSKTWGKQLLLSGGRDRQIFICDMSDNFKVLNTLKLHSGSITCLKPYHTDHVLCLVSTGLDRSVVLSNCSVSAFPTFAVRFNRHLSSSCVDCIFSEKDRSLCLGTLNGDICIFSLHTLNHLRTFPATHYFNSRVEKLAHDSKSNLLLVACSDRFINIIGYKDGQILASIVSHAAGASGLHFCVNSHCAISSSTDGCIFIWGLTNKKHSGSHGTKSNVAIQNMSNSSDEVSTMSFQAFIHPKEFQQKCAGDVRPIPVEQQDFSDARSQKQDSTLTVTSSRISTVSDVFPCESEVEDAQSKRSTFTSTDTSTVVEAESKYTNETAPLTSNVEQVLDRNKLSHFSSTDNSTVVEAESKYTNEVSPLTFNVGQELDWNKWSHFSSTDNSTVDKPEPKYTDEVSSLTAKVGQEPDIDLAGMEQHEDAE